MYLKTCTNSKTNKQFAINIWIRNLIAWKIIINLIAFTLKNKNKQTKTFGVSLFNLVPVSNGVSECFPSSHISFFTFSGKKIVSMGSVSVCNKQIMKYNPQHKIVNSTPNLNIYLLITSRSYKFFHKTK